MSMPAGYSNVWVKDWRAIIIAMNELPEIAREQMWDYASGAATRWLAKHARSSAPRLTGELARHVTARRIIRSHFWVVGVRRPESALTHLVEFGTQPHLIPRPRRSRLAKAFGARQRMIKHPGARPQPFLQTTLRIHSDKALHKARRQIQLRFPRLLRELRKTYRARARWAQNF